MAEELGVYSTYGDSAAVDRQERGGTAAAVVVDNAGNDVLTGTVFTGDEDGKVAGSDYAGHLDGEVQGGIVSDDVVPVLYPL